MSGLEGIAGGRVARAPHTHHSAVCANARSWSIACAQHTNRLATLFHEEAYGLRPVSSAEVVLRGGTICFVCVCNLVACRMHEFGVG